MKFGGQDYSSTDDVTTEFSKQHKLNGFPSSTGPVRGRHEFAEHAY
jgi:hypothetical protein